jgi:hypothetical protein
LAAEHASVRLGPNEDGVDAGAVAAGDDELAGSRVEADQHGQLITVAR